GAALFLHFRPEPAVLRAAARARQRDHGVRGVLDRGEGARPELASSRLSRIAAKLLDHGVKQSRATIETFYRCTHDQERLPALRRRPPAPRISKRSTGRPQTRASSARRDPNSR